MTQAAYARKIGMSKQYINKLVRLNVIVLEGRKVNVVQADKAIAEQQDPTRDAQRDANSKKRDGGVFDEAVIPKESLATMSDEQKKKYNEELAQTMQKLQDVSTEEENLNRPALDAGSKEWNTFKIMQQGLNYEIDRKVKEGTLMYLDDFKATLEIVLGPMNQSLDDLAFNCKSQFPDVGDEVIQWLLNRTNQMKVDVQNVSI